MENHIDLIIYIIGYIIAIIETNSDVCNYKNNITNSQSLINEQCVFWIIPSLIIM